MTERDIQKILFDNWVKNRRKRKFKIAVPNIYMYNWESDFLGLTSYGFFHEFEIKLNYNDFLADKNKKHKHSILENYHRSPGDSVYFLPKRFYYVIHGFWIAAKDLPPYAGLIAVTDSGQIKRIRTAPDLPATKITDKQTAKLATSLCFRYWSLL